MEIELPAGQPQPGRLYAEPAKGHISLGRPLRLFLFLALMAVWLVVLYDQSLLRRSAPGILYAGAGAVVFWTLVSGIRVAAQWERAVVLRFGRYNGLQGPGLLYAIPLMDYVRFVDTRTLVLNVPSQRVITKDNVPATIDGALFFQVTDPETAVTRIQDYKFAAAQCAQAALRDVVGGLSLDELLAEREQIQSRVGEIVDRQVSPWGLHIESIRMLDIELPEELKRMMSRQASAEREKRATITKAEGDKLAAANLAEAALIMRNSPGAMRLRSLQTIDGLGPSPSNTVVLFPAELTELAREAAERLGQPQGGE